MIRLLAIILIGGRFAPYYLNLPDLYFVMIDFSIILLLIKQKEVTIMNNFIKYALIMFIGFFLLNEFNPYNGGFTGSIPIIAILFFFLLLIVNHEHYSWEKIKGVKQIDKDKVYLIVKKPKGIKAYLGVLWYKTPFSSTCYLHNNQVMKYSNKTKKLELKYFPRFIPKSNIKLIETDLEDWQFVKRFNELKGKPYNIFTNNCRSIFNKSHGNFRFH